MKVATDSTDIVNSYIYSHINKYHLFWLQTINGNKPFSSAYLTLKYVFLCLFLLRLFPKRCYPWFFTLKSASFLITIGLFTPLTVFALCIETFYMSCISDKNHLQKGYITIHHLTFFRKHPALPLKLVNKKSNKKYRYYIKVYFIK
jgi:hypothetical protein